MGNEQTRHVQDKRYPSGNVYSGEMVGNKRHGQGTLTWPDGAKYEGTWKDDFCHGKGRMQFPNGSVYVGSFSSNNMNGQGSLTTVNGEALEGFWEYQGRSDASNTPIGKYRFNGQVVDLKNGNKRAYSGPLAFYLLSGLVSLPNMTDPTEALLPYAVVIADDGKGDAALAEQGRVLFQQGLVAPDTAVAMAVQTAPSSSSSVAYGQPDAAFQKRHPDDHAAYSLLDPRLYLNGLGFNTQPANINQKKQEAVRAQQQQQLMMAQSSSAVPIAVPVVSSPPPPGQVQQGIVVQPQAQPTPQTKPMPPVMF